MIDYVTSAPSDTVYLCLVQVQFFRISLIEQNIHDSTLHLEFF